MTAEAWAEVARQVIAGERLGLTCPEKADDYLTVDWVPGPDGQPATYRLRCPTCAAEVVVQDG